MFSSDWALENDFELDARLVKSRELSPRICEARVITASVSVASSRGILYMNRGACLGIQVHDKRVKLFHHPTFCLF